MSNKIPKYLLSTNKLQILYLTGIRHYFHILGSRKNADLCFPASQLFTLFGVNWFIHKMKNEFYQRGNPNFVVPSFVYKARRDNYIYFELSRIARGLPTTFTYYYYDDITDFTFYVNKKGEHVESKNVFTQERSEYLENQLFEPIYRQYYWKRSPYLIKTGNLLVAYNKFVEDRHDLDNYLHHKTINLMDFIRGVWYSFQTKLGFTNAYFYDHIISKPDIIYEYEKVKLALNIPKLEDDMKPYKYNKVLLLQLNAYQDYRK